MNESPPGNGTGARQGADPQDEKRDTRQLADSSRVVNRELIRSERIFKVVEVIERRRRFVYEVSDGTRTWVYPLKWSAFLKFDRLVAKQEGGEQP
jgi:hypothetical protein